jgi:hypothetical protein
MKYWANSIYDYVNWTVFSSVSLIIWITQQHLVKFTHISFYENLPEFWHWTLIPVHRQTGFCITGCCLRCKAGQTLQLCRAHCSVTPSGSKWTIKMEAINPSETLNYTWTICYHNPEENLKIVTAVKTSNFIFWLLVWVITRGMYVSRMTKEDRMGWCSGNSLDSYFGGTGFESRLSSEWFSSVSSRKFRDSTSIRPRLLPSKCFPNHHSSVIQCSVVQHR